MEAWREVLRRGFLPHMPTRGLEALARALVEDDPRLMQGATTSPPPLACVADWPVEAACLISYCGWQDGLATVGETEEFFSRACFACDQEMAEAAACRHLLNFWDETLREEARQALLPEIEAELARRAVVTEG